MSLSDFDIRLYAGLKYWPHKISWESFFPILFFFSESVYEELIFFFKYLLEFSEEAIWAWIFLVGSILTVN